MSPDSEDAVPFGKTSPTNSTLWAMPPVFFHSTVSPTLTVTVLGMNSPGASLMTITAAGSSRPLGPASAGLVRHTKPATAMATSAAARTRCILGVVPIIVGLLRDKTTELGLKDSATSLPPIPTRALARPSLDDGREYCSRDRAAPR